MVTLPVPGGTVNATSSPVLCGSCSSTCDGSELATTGREQLAGTSLPGGVGVLLEQAARSKAAPQQGIVLRRTSSSDAVRDTLIPGGTVYISQSLRGATVPW
jgi:hypothetical protein